MNFRPVCFSLLVAATAFTTVGCATYQDYVRQARDHLEDGDPALAVTELKPLANKPGKDQLVYVLDYATALQAEGRYKLSNKYFDLADQLSDWKDYINLSREAGSLLFAQELVQYKGEDYEKLLINLMEALNYLMLGDHQDARVEVRAMSNKLAYFKEKEDKSYEQNTMALYLSGLMWEDDHDFDSAYIEYAHAYKHDPNIPSLHEALVRTAKLAGRTQAYKKWSKKFHIKWNPKWTDPHYGELVLIYEQGWAPRKYPMPNAPEYPELFPVQSVTQSARLIVAGGPSVKTQTVFSVQKVAMKTLNGEYKTLAEKQLAGFAAKQVVASQVSQKNQALGTILDIAMQASDRADLRQWSTLPQTFQVARVFLKVGSYKVSVQGLTADGTPSIDSRAPQTFKIEPRRKTFFIWRSFH